MTRDTLLILKQHLPEDKYNAILNTIQEHLPSYMYQGIASKVNKEPIFNGLIKKAIREDNKAKVYYGLLKEPEFSSNIASEAKEVEVGTNETDADKPKKKLKKLFSKKTKLDPNAPPIDRIPLPELKEQDALEKIKAMREASERVKLGANCLPSICFYTLMNASHNVIAAEVSDDSSLLAVSFTDSSIRVWSLSPEKLKIMKNSEELDVISSDADDILERMMDGNSAKTSRTLYGHNGPVFCLSFSPDKKLLLSSSEDGSVRLWCLLTWTCVICYKGHIYPVWSVRFSPLGYYFVTGSYDKTARLWAIDSHQPLRIFCGHYSDVDVVQFHPNLNYIATGSSDTTVRLWDCATGNQVRLMTGHRAPIYSLSFSTEGRFLASAGADFRLIVWDLSNGNLIATLSSHTATVYCLSFSRDGNLLASGSLDCTIKLWDFTKIKEEIEDISKKSDSKTNPYLIRSFETKSSPILTLHFTRKNLMFGVGRFDASK